MNRRLKAKTRNGGGLITRWQAQVTVERRAIDSILAPEQNEKDNTVDPQSHTNWRSSAQVPPASSAARFPVHREYCPFYKWEMREASLITKTEMRNELLDHLKEWSEPEEEVEMKKKYEDALARKGAIGWYLDSQKAMVKQYKEDNLKGCVCTCKKKSDRFGNNQ